MADPIEAHYTPDGDDWTVAVTGRGRTLTGRAPGLIAARDRADQLVEELAPEESGHKTVVHMLNGDAVEFTTAYLTARLARTEEPAPQEPPAEAESPADKTAPAEEAPADGKAPEAQAAQEAPTPAKSAEAEHPRVVKPTPAPRTESEASRPVAQPTPTEAPTEQKAPSTS